MLNEPLKPVMPSEIPANRQLVEHLFSQGLITQGARDHALELVYPARNWALWVSRLLLAVGAALVLSGIVYFFAFNWAAIEDHVKLLSVAAGMAGCLGFVHFYGLERRTGQVMLLAAGVLTGVFLAVFGQVYQTGADAYTLFTAWALLILPWVGVSCFAGMWVLWLGIANVALLLWWDQHVLPSRDMESLILVLLAGFNGAFLGGREVFSKGREWLEGRWTRVLLSAAVLVCITIPGLGLILDYKSPHTGIVIGGFLSPFVIAGFYFFYRHVRADMQVLSLAVLAGCALIETAAGRAIFEAVDVRFAGAALPMLFMGFFTIGLFSAAVVWLRRISQAMEVKACPAT